MSSIHEATHCPGCGWGTVRKSGVSAKGIPWVGAFCEHDCGTEPTWGSIHEAREARTSRITEDGYSPVCIHGQRRYSSGLNARGKWEALFCPLEKDQPGQCEALFVNVLEKPADEINTRRGEPRSRREAPPSRRDRAAKSRYGRTPRNRHGR